MVRVTLRVRAPAREGADAWDAVAVVGDAECLGGWRVGSALAMQAVGARVHEAVFEMDAEALREMRYKYALVEIGATMRALLEEGEARKVSVDLSQVAVLEEDSLAGARFSPAVPFEQGTTKFVVSGHTDLHRHASGFVSTRSTLHQSKENDESRCVSESVSGSKSASLTSISSNRQTSGDAVRLVHGLGTLFRRLSRTGVEIEDSDEKRSTRITDLSTMRSIIERTVGTERNECSSAEAELSHAVEPERQRSSADDAARCTFADTRHSCASDHSGFTEATPAEPSIASANCEPDYALKPQHELDLVRTSSATLPSPRSQSDEHRTPAAHEPSSSHQRSSSLLPDLSHRTLRRAFAAGAIAVCAAFVAALHNRSPTFTMQPV
uniref:CBM20 domain-containing protein n=1 Tax=Erythrolobus australicus TaxID=1077150 RepID=A0A7S1XI47_9RHOD|mmetsp:Transcript_2222/g.6036  ORF Transcript_2222/g.6036 Transcript_2222/m.6036 type:complete len:382 (+) Transcript_2222:352-1497(+)